MVKYFNNKYKKYILFSLLFLVVFCILYFIHLQYSFYEHFEDNDIKIAVITSIYGDYDDLIDIENVIDRDKLDWYCFTDKEKNHSEGWKVILDPYHLTNTEENDELKEYKNFFSNIEDDQKILNMMSAKYYKTQSHHIDLLKDYDYYIWIDGSLILRDSFVKTVYDFIHKKKYKLVNFKHSAREKIKDESHFSNTLQRYKEQNVLDQYQNYIKDSFKDDQGLFENGFFIRINKNEINKLFDDWWLHNLQYSYQDQISYPYLLWKNNIRPDHIIKYSIYDNKELCHFKGHK